MLLRQLELGADWSGGKNEAGFDAEGGRADGRNRLAAASCKASTSLQTFGPFQATHPLFKQLFSTMRTVSKGTYRTSGYGACASHNKYDKICFPTYCHRGNLGCVLVHKDWNLPRNNSGRLPPDDLRPWFDSKSPTGLGQRLHIVWQRRRYGAQQIGAANLVSSYDDCCLQWKRGYEGSNDVS